MSSNELLGFVVFSQDWRHHQFGDPAPPVTQTWFATRREAEECKSRLRQRFPNNDNFLLCIAPASKLRKAKARGRGSC